MPTLDPDRWRALEPHLDAALDLSDAGRREWLDNLRARDPSLADDLQTLIVEHQELDRVGFLAKSPPHPNRNPIVQEAATLTGQVIGAYTLQSRIGHGGMGTVWLAKRSDGRFEGQAAVKLLNTSLIGRSGEERFAREGTILARLSHPSIARLIDAGVSRTGQPYLVLEYVQGHHIDRYCDERRLDVHARIRLFIDVLTAVAHAHVNLVVHRDIKPSNVLVPTSDDAGALTTTRVKLLDFGIAKLMELGDDPNATFAVTNESGWAMTPAYAAPEQLSGGAITTASDVYSLGVLLYLLLSGYHPVGSRRRSPAELISTIVDTDMPRLSDALQLSQQENGDEAVQASAKERSTTPDRLRRALHGDLDTIVATALKKDPRQRYQSVTAFADDLQRFLDQRPISARPDTWTYRATTFVKRHTRSVAAAVAVVVVITAMTAFYTTRLAAARERAQMQAQKAAKISELLSGLLTGADPYATRETRGEPTVRQLLDAGAVRVERELADQPELQAEMMTVIGRVYQRLGLDAKAQPLLEQALALGRRTLGPEDVRIARSLNELGTLLREKGDVAASAKAFEEALVMRRHLLGNKDKDVAVTAVELARSYVDLGKYDLAEPLLREALAIRLEVFGDRDRNTATSLSDLGQLLRDRGQIDEAERYLRQSLEVARKTLADDHPDVATATSNVASVLVARGDVRGAEALYRQALAIYRKHPNGIEIRIGLALNNLSGPLREQKKFAEAEAALDEATALVHATRGDDHLSMALVLVSRGRLKLARGEPALAEPVLRRALEIRQRTLPANDWRVGIAKSVLGEALTGLHRYQEAELLLLEAHDALKTTQHSRYTRDAKANVARLVALYEAWHQPDKATPYRALLTD
jgi:serine/threonine protein kinase/tetratricopeptide (TPR) repeat protein